MSTPPNEPNTGSGPGDMFEKQPGADAPDAPPPPVDGPATQYQPGAPGPEPQPGGQYPAGGQYGYPPMGGQPQGAYPPPQQGGFPPQGGVPQGSYPSYPQQPQQPYGQPQQPYGQQQYQPYPPVPYGAPQPRSGPQIFSIIGFICAGIALLFCPPGFGIAAIVLGLVGNSKGEPLGKWAAIAGGVCLVLGMIFSFLIVGTDGLMPSD